MYFNLGELKIKINTYGIWGHFSSRNKEYILSGQKGKYPSIIYRFTMVGEGSRLPDEFNDIFLEKENVRVGYSNSLFIISEVNG